MAGCDRRWARLVLALSWVTVAALAAGAQAAPRQVQAVVASRADFEACTRDVHVDTSTRAGAAQLAPTVLVRDVSGDHIAAAPGPPGAIAKKVIILGSGAIWGAEIYMFHSVGRLRVNGHEASEVRRLDYGGWGAAQAEGSWLHAGANEVVLAAGGLTYDRDRNLGRSYISGDGGETWRAIPGEWMVQVRLERYPARGVLVSPVIDLAALAAGGPVRPLVRVKQLRATAQTQCPTGTWVEVEVRSGATPSYRPDTWSVWRSGGGPGRRYAQWRATLRTRWPQRTPVLERVEAEADLEVVSDADLRAEVDSPRIARGSYPFRYQKPSPRLAYLRRRWTLDEVIAPGRTQFEQFVLLRDWVRHQWRGWEGDVCRPWDAIEILSAPPDNRGMCVHFGVVFTQCALALGFNARQVILNHHYVAEAWSDEYGKWVVMDVGPGIFGEDGWGNMHFVDRRTGVPMSALELHRAYAARDPGRVDLVPNAPQDDAEVTLEMLANYQRFAIPLRNDFLDAPEPQEKAHGFDQYHSNDYLWWKDEARSAYPEYPLQTNREDDFSWTLNQTAIDLQATQRRDRLRVTFDTVTPNFDGYLVRVDGGVWKERPASWVWGLHTGVNRLEARVRNAFGRLGPVSRASVWLEPPPRG